MPFPYFPPNYVHPVITVEQALARGVSPESLLTVAKWNERKARGAAKDRRLRQAAELRAVAAELVARAMANEDVRMAA